MRGGEQGRLIARRDITIAEIFEEKYCKNCRDRKRQNCALNRIIGIFGVKNIYFTGKQRNIRINHAVFVLSEEISDRKDTDNKVHDNNKISESEFEIRTVNLTAEPAYDQIKYDSQ